MKKNLNWSILNIYLKSKFFYKRFHKILQREFFYVKRLIKLTKVYEYKSIKIISNYEQDLEMIINRKINKKKTKI